MHPCSKMQDTQLAIARKLFEIYYIDKIIPPAVYRKKYILDKYA